MEEHSKSTFLLSFDIDYPEDVESLTRVLSSLDFLDIKASFAGVGAWIEKFPKEHNSIIERGHELFNHTYTHPSNKVLSPTTEYWQLSEEEKTDEIIRCDRISTDLFGYKMKGFRLPHFGNVQTVDFHWLSRLLVDLGYDYDSSVLFFNYKKTMKLFQNSSLHEIPVTTCYKHPFTALDSYHTVRSNRTIYRLLHSKWDWDLLLSKALYYSRLAKVPVNIYLDPFDYAKHIESFEKTFINLMKDNDLIFQTYGDYTHRIGGL